MSGIWAIIGANIGENIGENIGGIRCGASRGWGAGSVRVFALPPGAEYELQITLGGEMHSGKSTSLTTEGLQCRHLWLYNFMEVACQGRGSYE